MVDQATIREAVAVFDNAKELEQAIDDLESSGFDRAEISLLATEHAIEEKLGHKYQKVTELEDDPVVPRTAYVSTEAMGDAEGGLVGGLLYIGAVAAAGAVVATGGTLAATLAAASMAGASGGFLGTILAALLDRRHAEYLSDQVNRGGLLVWVRTTDEGREKRAADILSRHSAHDVHVHSIPAERT